ncbi:hypothetical protein VTH06DRAFT_1946 [Thermothelomyces fergusii]
MPVSTVTSRHLPTASDLGQRSRRSLGEDVSPTSRPFHRLLVWAALADLAGRGCAEGLPCPEEKDTENEVAADRVGEQAELQPGPGRSHKVTHKPRRPNGSSPSSRDFSLLFEAKNGRQALVEGISSVPERRTKFWFRSGSWGWVAARPGQKHSVRLRRVGCKTETARNCPHGTSGGDAVLVGWMGELQTGAPQKAAEKEEDDDDEEKSKISRA